MDFNENSDEECEVKFFNSSLVCGLDESSNRQQGRQDFPTFTVDQSTFLQGSQGFQVGLYLY